MRCSQSSCQRSSGRSRPCCASKSRPTPKRSSEPPLPSYPGTATSAMKGHICPEQPAAISLTGRLAFSDRRSSHPVVGRTTHSMHLDIAGTTPHQSPSFLEETAERWPVRQSWKSSSTLTDRDQHNQRHECEQCLNHNNTNSLHQLTAILAPTWLSGHVQILTFCLLCCLIWDRRDKAVDVNFAGTF